MELLIQAAEAVASSFAEKYVRSLKYMTSIG